MSTGTHSVSDRRISLSNASHASRLEAPELWATNKHSLKRALTHHDLLWLLTRLVAKAQQMDSEEQTGGESCQKATLVTKVVINKGEKA